MNLERLSYLMLYSTHRFSLCAGRLINTFRWRNLSTSHGRASVRPFSSGIPRVSSVMPPSYLVYPTKEDLEEPEVWPEEDLTSTIINNGGFYPARIGESFDNGRYVVIRKLGFGNFSNVWLAKDRKFVLNWIFTFF